MRLSATNCFALRLSVRQRRAITSLWDAAQSDASLVESALQPQQSFTHNDAGIQSDAYEVPISPNEISSRFLRCHRAAGSVSPIMAESLRCPSKVGNIDGGSCSSKQTDLSYDERTRERSEGTDDSDAASSSDESVETSRQSCSPCRRPQTGRRGEWTSLHTTGSVSANTPVNDSLADAAGGLFAFLCMEEFMESKSSSALLVYFCGTLGFSSNGLGFERPRNYTPKLSAMIYCVRLCLLELTLPRFAHSSATWGARPHFGHLKCLNPIRESFLCNGCQAPMGELLSLRTFGRALSRADGPSFRVRWSEDSETVSWDDGQISMDEFRRLGQVQSS